MYNLGPSFIPHTTGFPRILAGAGARTMQRSSKVTTTWPSPAEPDAQRPFQIMQLCRHSWGRIKATLMKFSWGLGIFQRRLAEKLCLAWVLQDEQVTRWTVGVMVSGPAHKGLAYRGGLGQRWLPVLDHRLWEKWSWGVLWKSGQGPDHRGLQTSKGLTIALKAVMSCGKGKVGE